MKRIVLALALLLAPSLAWAQCTGVFSNNTVCGNATGSSNTPRMTAITALPAGTITIGTTPIAGGTNTYILYYNAGVVGNEQFIPLAQGGLGGSQAAATANQVPVFPGSGGAAVPTTITPAIIGSLFANPTASIGLTAVNGVALTAMRSDAAPALSQAITPTWTGSHTFTNATISAAFQNGVVNINPTANSLGQGINLAQSMHGTLAGLEQANLFNISTDDAAITGGNSLYGWEFLHNFGGSNLQGARNSMLVTSGFSAQSSASNANKAYVTFTGSMNVYDTDGGTNTGLGAKGSFYAANFLATTSNALSKNATNLATLVGGEVDIALITGSSARLKYGWSVVSLSDDAVQGAVEDAGYELGSETGAVGFNYGWYTSAANGQYPIKSNGTLFGSAAGTVNHAIDVSAITCTTDCWKSIGAIIDGSGNATFNTASLAATSNQLVFQSAGITGTISWSPSSTNKKITLPNGTTDFTGTGGTSQVVKQVSAGAAFTVGQLANTDITGLGTIATQAASSVAITGGTVAGLTGLGTRDTSAAFDVTIAATSSPALTAGRTLTLNMEDVAHILTFGTTANTGSGIIFPNTATDTVAMLGVANTFTNTNAFAGVVSIQTAVLNVNNNASGTNVYANVVTNATSNDTAFVFQNGTDTNAYFGEVPSGGCTHGDLCAYIGGQRFSITKNGNVVMGSAAIATTATDGFLYIATSAGTPTGTPTTFTGRVPMVYDTTNHQFWIYDGGWKQPKTPAGAALVTWQ